MKSIILIGMPSCGKSTVGVVLAKATGLSFCDTDILISQHSGKTISKLIGDLGNEGFLKLEQQVILSASFDNTVVATGGSVVYSQAAINHFKKYGTVYYLKITKEDMLCRIKNAAARGVILPDNQTLSQMYDSRVKLYECSADITVDCRGKSLEEIVSIIVSNYEI